MRRLIESKFYRILDYGMRLILLNFIFVMISLSFFLFMAWRFPNLGPIQSFLVLIPTLITFLPCWVSLIDVIIKYELNESNSVFKEYFNSFKKYFLKTVSLSIILVISIRLLYNSYDYFYNHFEESITNALGLFLTFLVVILLLFILINLPFWLIKDPNLRMIHYLKLAMTTSFINFIETAMCLMLIIISIFLTAIFTWGIILWSISLPGYLVVKILRPRYYR